MISTVFFLLSENQQILRFFIKVQEILIFVFFKTSSCQVAKETHSTILSLHTRNVCYTESNSSFILLLWSNCCLMPWLQNFKMHKVADKTSVKLTLKNTMQFFLLNSSNCDLHNVMYDTCIVQSAFMHVIQCDMQAVWVLLSKTKRTKMV